MFALLYKQQRRQQKQRTMPIFTPWLQQGEFHSFSYLASHFLLRIFSCSSIFIAFSRYLPLTRKTVNSLDKFLLCDKTHWCIRTCGYWNLVGWMHCLECQDRNRFYPCIATLFVHHACTVFMKWRTHCNTSPCLTMWISFNGNLYCFYNNFCIPNFSLISFTFEVH